MKKKTLGLVMAAVMMSSIFSGCAKEANTPEAETKNNTNVEEGSDEVQKDAEQTEKVESSAGTFTVGFDQDFPPMGFVGDDGEFTGFDLDLAKEVAGRLGLEIVYQPIAWDAKDMELKTGSIDCIWNGFTIDGREDKYAWTSPYMANQQVFVVNAEAEITGFADLAGKTVAVQSDSSAEKALQSNEALTSTFETLKVVADYNTGMMELESGAVDAVAMDETVASYQLKKRGDGKFKILEETLAEEEYGVGFELNNTELRDKVQSTLEEMGADGTLTKISEEWFGKDVTILGK